LNWFIITDTKQDEDGELSHAITYINLEMVTSYTISTDDDENFRVRIHMVNGGDKFFMLNYEAAQSIQEAIRIASEG